jgi:hypothetical protein
MRIGTQGTTLHRLRRSKEVSATTWPTIQKIPDDYGVLLDNYIYRNICKIGILHGSTTIVQGCSALATDTPTPLVDVIL